MNIIKFNGGIGNQLFQYSFYLACLDNDIEIGVDLTIYEREKIHGGFLLNDILLDNFKLYTAISSEASIMYNQMGFYERIIIKFFGKTRKHYFERSFKDYDKIFKFLKSKSNIYLVGYWQNIKYVEIVLERLKKSIKPKVDLISNEFLSKVNAEESVSIHVRLGDYNSNLDSSKLYMGICTKKYYEKAIEIIKNLVKKPKFYLFSDDPENASLLFPKMDNLELISSVEKEYAYKDMFKMSACKYHIIANSSFSWWAAVLSENQYIISPEKWNNSLEANYLKLKNSIIINSDGVVIEKI